MPNLPISGFPAATLPLGATDAIPVVQGGVSKKAPVSALAALGATGATGATGSTGSTGATGAGATGATGASAVLGVVVCTGSQATVQFSSIPATYRHLEIEYIARDTSGGIGANIMRMKINGDATAGNYTSEQYVAGGGSTASAGTDASTSAGAFCGNMCGVSGDAGSVASGTISIIGYSQTALPKAITFTGMQSVAGLNVNVRAFVWKSTAAITDIAITAPGTAFLDGSIFTLVGKVPI